MSIVKYLKNMSVVMNAVTSLRLDYLLVVMNAVTSLKYVCVLFRNSKSRFISSFLFRVVLTSLGTLCCLSF